MLKPASNTSFHKIPTRKTEKHIFKKLSGYLSSISVVETTNAVKKLKLGCVTRIKITVLCKHNSCITPGGGSISLIFLLDAQQLLHACL